MYERDLEQYLFEYPEALSFENFKVDRWIGRQYRVTSGIIDLIGLHGRDIIIVELKNQSLKSRAITQVSRYAGDIGMLLAHLSYVVQDEYFEKYYNKGIEKDWLEFLRIFAEWQPYNNNIIKVVIAKNVKEKRVLYEAYSLDVNIITFDNNMVFRWVSFQEDIAYEQSDIMRYDHNDKCQNEIKRMLESDIFRFDVERVLFNREIINE